MVRRPHKKSRFGCTECKRRHMKCDEKRPICGNCVASERLCGYAELTVLAMQSGNTRAGKKRARSPASSSMPDTPPELTALAQPDPPVNILHVELFHHLSTQTFPSISETGSGRSLPLGEIIEFGLAAPYLLNELLALAALHLGIIRAPQKGKSPSVPAFCFASILGVHLLCDTLVFRDDANETFLDFLDRFIHYLRIHRGARTMIAGNWGALKQTSLEPVLSGSEASLRTKDEGRGDGDADVCNSLLARIRAAKLGAATTGTYEAAIESLQHSLNPSAAEGATAIEKMHGAVAWPVMVSAEYTDMLAQRRPEALVILAHYAVSLHACRDMWVFGDGGEFLIRSIDRYLGVEWAEWMEWPTRVSGVSERTNPFSA
ncbi:hypothetical protein ASPVEDRAFT_87755 [Aspergillus versicolor CBS 583.65]|uniref:Zn(2)-C6 fungal-type domain-containing protein n=1 Tax=Aspergillus versicolor CBS 583.65 TaxID=1036611 RepID=A0A1L9PYE5_ASPVE|nr:uncharacterized protein ASPVEDRAFT_87755 [Aspergillus versicolor CBS 583.65]OJJ06456.1 hypothetical protein ASPVEDRAFT_87755 [Aspergillus versicolor CBS 583.65]